MVEEVKKVADYLTEFSEKVSKFECSEKYSCWTNVDFFREEQAIPSPLMKVAHYRSRNEAFLNMLRVAVYQRRLSPEIRAIDLGGLVMGEVSLRLEVRPQSLTLLEFPEGVWFPSRQEEVAFTTGVEELFGGEYIVYIREFRVKEGKKGNIEKFAYVLKGGEVFERRVKGKLKQKLAGEREEVRRTRL
ncbi:MAG TPA: hypothetical protein ENF51_01515 [Candidatus Aenigmarchaeota archaeon]|nr:hypothetical protein [Candidatus Aenigmarchaeota archaeon]